MIDLTRYIRSFTSLFADHRAAAPWEITTGIRNILLAKMKVLGTDYRIFNEVAIHKSVFIDSHAIIKGPAIISAHCFIGANAYLRGGLFLDEHVSIGPACEVKTSFLFAHSALGHFNFVGDSVLGASVNLEAGAVVANHYNERADKKVCVTVDGTRRETGVSKFGALIGDDCKIGANAVLSPGTVLPPGSIVARLQLVEQNPLTA